MVATKSEPEDMFLYSASNPSKTLQAWSDSIAAVKERFFELTRSFSAESPAGEIDGLIANVERQFQQLDHAPYPMDASGLRWHLLSAINDILLGLREARGGDKKAAKAYMKAAQVELGFLEIELVRMGVAVA